MVNTTCCETSGCWQLRQIVVYGPYLTLTRHRPIRYFETTFRSLVRYPAVYIRWWYYVVLKRSKSQSLRVALASVTCKCSRFQTERQVLHIKIMHDNFVLQWIYHRFHKIKRGVENDITYKRIDRDTENPKLYHLPKTSMIQFLLRLCSKTAVLDASITFLSKYLML